MIGDTASINLLTGLPGAGKSLRLVESILHAQSKGLLVYVCNIDGLKVPGVMPWDDPRKWQELPAGSILVCDEAQEFFPARRSGDPPDYVKAMSKIRHEGVRLILATQQPDYLDSYLRGLVGFHEHLYRIAGKEKSFIFRNHQLMDQVRASLKRIKSLYDHEQWAFPTQLFSYYESAQVHTVKYKMPALMKKVLIAAPLALALFGAPIGFLAYNAYKARSDAAAATDSAAPVPPGGAPQGATSAKGASEQKPADKRVEMTRDEYVLAQVPRVIHEPWSAPIYDQVNNAPRSKPEYYCMASRAGLDAQGEQVGDTCSCLTEQGTRYEIDMQTCFAVVKQGGVYNPYREPNRGLVPQRDMQQEQRDDERRQPVSRPALAMPSEEQQAAYGSMRGKAYPAYTFSQGAL